ncbi:hypothetical protein EBR16_07335, partial [bacterium]|nr:hypothetical protein [bacterium]
NTFLGDTVVDAGTLAVSADANLGATPTVLDAAAITLDGATLNATGSFTLDAKRGLTLTAASNLGVDAGATLTYGGAVSGAFGLTKVGAGSLVLTGPKAVAGDLIVAEGNVSLASAANDPALAPAVGGALTIGAGLANASVTLGTTWGNNTRGPQLDPTKVVTFGAGAFASVLNINGSTQTIRGLVASADADGAVVQNNVASVAATAAVLNLAPQAGDSFVFTGNLRSGTANALYINKYGAGTQTFVATGKAGYAEAWGRTDVFQGSLVFQDLTAFGAASIGIRGNATLAFTGNSELVLDKTYAGSGTLVLDNAGRTTLTSTGYGSSTFLGDIDIRSGVVRLGNSQVFGTTSGSTYVRAGATLDLAGQGSNLNTTTATNERLVLAGAGVGGQGALVNSYVNAGVPAYFLRNVVLAANTTLGVDGRIDIRDNGGTSLLDMGGFDLTKNGAGVLELGLTSPLSNPGNLNVNAGSLLLEFGTDLGAPSGKAINLAATTGLSFYATTARQRWTINAADGTTINNNQDSSTVRYDG